MRLKVAGLRGVVKRDLPIEFTRDQLTSYGGLELLRRYFWRIGLQPRVRRALAGCGMGSDYGASRLVVLLVTLFVVGARRRADQEKIGRRRRGIDRNPAGKRARGKDVADFRVGDPDTDGVERFAVAVRDRRVGVGHGDRAAVPVEQGLVAVGDRARAVVPVEIDTRDAVRGACVLDDEDGRIDDSL